MYAQYSEKLRVQPWSESMVQRKNCSEQWIRARISLDVKENIEKKQLENGGKDRCVDNERSKSPTAHLEKKRSGSIR